MHILMHRNKYITILYINILKNQKKYSLFMYVSLIIIYMDFSLCNILIFIMYHSIQKTILRGLHLSVYLHTKKNR